MKIAMVGTRGIPANYGGSETCVEEVGKRLVARGHQVTVYCRQHNSPSNTSCHLGMRRVVLPSLHKKNWDTLTHSSLAVMHAIGRERPDVIHFHGVGNAVLLPLLQPFGSIRSILTVDGPDWLRPKWGTAARAVLLQSAKRLAPMADALICDSVVGLATYENVFGHRARYIPYGADVTPVTLGASVLPPLGLRPNGYFLFVGRLIPDKGVHLLVEAFRGLPGDMQLVLVGDNPYFPEYIATLKRLADDRVRFLGYRYGDEYRNILANCYAYVQPSRVEGTSPSLLAAMGAGKCVIVNGIPENRATVADAGLAFDVDSVDSLREQMSLIAKDSAVVERYGRLARERVKTNFDWDVVADQHQELYREVVEGLPRV